MKRIRLSSTTDLCSSIRLEAAIQSHLQSWHQLLVVHRGVQAVVSAPLLGEVQSVLLHLVLGLQGAGHLDNLINNL